MSWRSSPSGWFSGRPSTKPESLTASGAALDLLTTAPVGYLCQLARALVLASATTPAAPR